MTRAKGTPTLPYENSQAGDRALGEIQKILRGFGCTKFGSWMDDAEGTITLQFVHRGRACEVRASMKGYAATWLKAHPHNANYRTTLAKHHERAMEVAGTAVYSILRDWIKGQITAIETGIVSFEGAFLGNMLLANGQTVLDHVEKTQLLPALAAPSP